MQAQLIYNDGAGAQDITVEDLQVALEQAGFDVTYVATNGEEDLNEALAKAEGLVVVAGGDGTVRGVAIRLVGKDRPMTILPMGTANNVANTLMLPNDPFEIIKGLKEPVKTTFDLGHIEAPWGEDYFVEGAGFGFFADVLATYDPEKGKSILRGLGSLGDTLIRGHAHETNLKFNGQEVAGKYLLVAILNTPAIGPRLKFDSRASPQDGQLSLVCIRENDRDGFLRYVTSLAREDMENLESVTVELIEEVSFAWQGFPFHVDGELRPPDWRERQEREETEFGPRVYVPIDESQEIKIRILPGAIKLWLPAQEDENDQE